MRPHTLQGLLSFQKSPTILHHDVALVLVVTGAEEDSVLKGACTFL